MGVRAVRDLQDRYPGVLDGVDLVVCATSSPDAYFPSTAALIAGQVGLAGAGAFDVSVACSGFVYALSVAQGMIMGGTARKVLVLGAEVLSKIVDWQDRTTCILFGDGAGAAIVEDVPDGYGFQSFVLGADSAGGSSLYKFAVADRIPGVPVGTGNAMLGMNGREVFKFAVRVLGDSGEQALGKAGLKGSDIDWLIPHQRTSASSSRRAAASGCPSTRPSSTSTGTATPAPPASRSPCARRSTNGRVKDGDQLLLVAFGGGLSWGASAMRWYGGRTETKRAAPAALVAR